MQDLQNNNWITLDPLGNIYEIYANLTAMTLLNQEHFWITQTELCLRAGFIQGNCTRQYFFLSQMWNYSKSLSTGIGAKNAFRTFLYFKKLKIIYSCEIYYILYWL